MVEFSKIQAPVAEWLGTRSQVWLQMVRILSGAQAVIRNDYKEEINFSPLHQAENVLRHSGGSRPSSATNAGLAQLEEQESLKLKVIGSNPIFRTNLKPKTMK